METNAVTIYVVAEQKDPNRVVSIFPSKAEAEDYVRAYCGYTTWQIIPFQVDHLRVQDAIEGENENQIQSNPHTQNDPVNHPSHYTQGKIECIDFIQDKKLNFFRGNAVKYIVRAGLKDPTKEVEDLQKAVFYLNREIKRLQEGDGNHA